MFIEMIDYELPNDQFYNAEPAIIKKLKEPILSKIYTYPIDKKIKWYKPFPEFLNADQDKYFFKYEYIRALRNKMENLQQALAQEQLREAIENQIEFNEIKKEDRQLQALNNFFKAGLFSFVMTDVKDKYLQNQAKELMKNNTTLLHLDNKIADIRKDDLESLSLSSANSDISKELNQLDEVKSNILKNLDEFDDFGENDLESIKDILDDMEKNEYISQPHHDNINETLLEVGELQNTEITEMLEKIGEATQTEIIEKRAEKQLLEKLLLEKQQEQTKLQLLLEKQQDRKDKIDDFKGKIGIQKNINNGYLSQLNTITSNNRAFEKKIDKLTTKGDITKQFKLAYDIGYLTKEELDSVFNNFPNIKSSTATERTHIRNNFNDLFKELIAGNKPEIKTLMEGIKYNKMIEGLEKQPFSTKYNKQKLEDLKLKVKKYSKTQLTGTGLKTGNENLIIGENLQKEIELFLDLESLIPNIQEGVFEDKPPTTEIHTPFEEEGGAY